MDQRTIQTLFALLRSSICGEKLSDEEKTRFSQAQLPLLAAIAKKHDVIHLLALGLKQNALVSGRETGMEKDILLAVYRHEQQRVEFEKLCRILELAEIPFMPLKGSVLRGYYPEAWMRTSCDVDILVKESDVERATAALVDGCGYVQEGKSSHDISLFAPNKTHIELHYKLADSGLANSAAEVLDRVWEWAQIRERCRYWHEMPDEVFYFYHVAHMAKHFENGGCGIRPFLDLWILDNLQGVNEEKRDALLAQGGLLKFAQTARKLSCIWFEGTKHSDLTKQMEQYILRGGVYGSSQNRIAVQQQKKGGQLKYVRSKLFLPYEMIKFQYPILQKHRWLTPVMEVRRWFRLVFSGRVRRRATQELKYSGGISDEETAGMQAFLNSIGL